MDQVCGERQVGDVTGLAGDPFHVAGGEGMPVPGGLFVFPPVMAVFTGMHGVVEVVPHGELQGVPFCELMFSVGGMAGDAAQSFCQASPEARRKLELLLRLRLRELTLGRARPLKEIMDEIGIDAEGKGLTPEILESVLREE